MNGDSFDRVHTPARWLSDHVAMCTVNQALTLAGTPIALQMSNNGGFDSSVSVLQLAVITDTMVADISPSRGFARGGTEVQVTFRVDYHGRLSCRFGGTVSSPAYQVDATSFVCVTPKMESGVSSIEIVDGSNVVLSSSAFEFIEVPATNADATLPTLLADTLSEIEILGTRFSVELTGRLRSAAGELVEGTCVYASSTSLLCTEVFVSGNHSFVFVELSANDYVDYVKQFATLQVFPPSRVVLVDPLVLNQGGGNVIGFSVDAFRTAFPTVCVFSAADSSISVASMATITGETEATCTSPELPLSVGVAWSLTQGSRTIYGPVQVTVVETPIISDVAPLVLTSGLLTSLHISFERAVFAFPEMQCMLQGIAFELNFLNSTYGVCVVQSATAGVRVPLRLRYPGAVDGGSTVASLEIVDSPSDLIPSRDHIVEFTPTNVTISSASCGLQLGTYCAGSGAPVSTALATNRCAVVCTVAPMQNKAHVRLDLCTSPECDAPIFSSVLTVMRAMSLVALKPSKGPVQGGEEVLLYGSGFVHDALLQCLLEPIDAAPAGTTGVVGPVAAVAAVISPTRALCRLPPAAPGNYSVSLARRGLVVSTSVVTFEYLPLLSAVVVQPTVISSLGGTVVTAVTQELLSSGPYYCRFEDNFFPALILNGSALMCVSPSFERENVTFAVAAEGSQDVSSEQLMQVAQPPGVVFADPLYFPADQSGVLFTVILDMHIDGSSSVLSAEHAAYTCLVDDVPQQLTVDGSLLLCTAPRLGLAVGEHSLALLVDGVEFYRTPVHARPPFNVQSVTPLTSFGSFASLVTLAVTQHNTGDDYSHCCFGDALTTPAMLVSSTQWQCYSPVVPHFPNTTEELVMSMGLARRDGFCESIGFDFHMFKPPKPLFLDVARGSVAGGTPFQLDFASLPPMDIVFCRLGLNTRMGMIVGIGSSRRSVRCVTDPNPVGIRDIEISSNGVDFIDTGFDFEFVPILRYPLNADGTIDDGTGDSALNGLPEPDSVQPVVYYVTPDQISTASEKTVDIFGVGFRPGSTCILGSNAGKTIFDSANNVTINGTAVSMELSTFFVSESNIQCVLPVHAPGPELISVDSSDGLLHSDPLLLTFLANDASLSTIDGFEIFPPYGPKNGETIVTIFGSNLDLPGVTMQCLIGEEFALAFDITPTSLKCIVPASQYSGKVPIKVAQFSVPVFLAGEVLFEYVEDPLLFDAQPVHATLDMDLLITGVGFLRSPNLTCFIGDVQVETAVISNTQAVCRVPDLVPGEYSVTFNTNGQHFVRSGLTIEFLQPTLIDRLFPLNGPALRGGTILSIFGDGFVDNIDLQCMIDTTVVPAIVRSAQQVQCRTPPHKPGLVNVSLLLDGALLHAPSKSLQFLYAPDVSVDKITPEFGYTAGDFPVFVFGSNFINTTALGCRFADLESRGIFLTNSSILCLLPSPLGHPELANVDSLAVEVTVNGLDYSESGIIFEYSEPCDQGFFCPGLSRQLCPNGTYCPVNSRNFTLCGPGTFQPREGQIGCALCPVGYICPDFGMSRPVNCPPGFICDVMGLRSSAKLCPAGHYCLNGTKADAVSAFQPETSAQWIEDFVTGVVTFNESSIDWSYKPWPAPAVGESRPNHPPERHCDGLVCSGGTTGVLAEAPFPCPIGHFCRAGAGTQIPVPKNFSTPQRCIDGFFCPRGSTHPEGSGPCPNGYFCPTQLDAIICPQGECDYLFTYQTISA